MDKKLWKRRVSGGIGTAVNLVCLGIVLLISPCFAGIRIYTVVSGSMEPGIPAGAAVYVKRTAFADIQKGDVITFLTENERVTVTHRVIGINRAKKTFLTKGDANQQRDGRETAFGQVQGVAAGVVPGAGYLFLLLKNRYVRAGMLLLLGAVLFSTLVRAAGKGKGQE